MSHARTVFLSELLFLCGVGCGRLPIALCVLAAALACTIVFVRPPLVVVVVFVCACALGVLRIQQTEGWQSADTIHTLSGQRVILTGTVNTAVERRLDRQRIVVHGKSIDMDGRTIRGSGRVVASLPLYPEVRYGDELRIRCALREPGNIEGFAYDEYLARYRIFSVCSSPSIVEHTNAPRSMVGILYALKNWIATRYALLVPEPQAALLSGVELGVQTGFSDNLQNAFRRAGISHIVVLSGYNITVLAGAVLVATIRCGGSRKHAYWVACGVLMLFVVMTGVSPSVLRAAVMGIACLTARHVGRANRVWYVLLFAATLMVMINPRILLSDTSFQLSFCATLGLVLFATPIRTRLGFLPERFGIRDALASTLAATIVTTPLIAVQFHRLSLVSPLANILVLPVIPLIMALGVVSLIPMVGPVCALLVWPLLTWVIACAEWLARFSWSSVATPNLPGWVALACYAVGSFVFICIRRWRPSHDAQTET